MRGQVTNQLYTLANPYPDRVVAVINQTSQIVDQDHRPVPLSEVCGAPGAVALVRMMGMQL